MDAVTAQRFTDLDTRTLYALLRLRVEVFVVEQRCAYQELDGWDTDPATWHVWIGSTDRVCGYLRVLRQDGIHRIGRVCTSKQVRGQGLGDRLMRYAMELTAGSPVELNAQTHATGFYRRHGFQPFGDQFLEDGIPHIGMRAGTIHQ